LIDLTKTDTYSANGEVECWIQRQVNDVDLHSDYIDDDIQHQSEAEMMLRKAYPIKHQFIPSEENY
jgi:hypothetical protein